MLNYLFKIKGVILFFSALIIMSVCINENAQKINQIQNNMQISYEK